MKELDLYFCLGFYLMQTYDAYRELFGFHGEPSAAETKILEFMAKERPLAQYEAYLRRLEVR